MPITGVKAYRYYKIVFSAGVNVAAGELSWISFEPYVSTEISYQQSTNGFKICAPDQADALAELYNKTGAAWYYILDTENKRFKVPRQNKRRLVSRTGDTRNGYNLYSDGWYEQWGILSPEGA